MKKYIADIPFCTNRHYNCVYVVLDSLLRFYGYEPTVLCFPHWDFIYLKDEPPAIQGRKIPLPKILNAFGIALCNHSANEGPSAWNEVKKLINTDTPVAVSLDVFPLAQADLFPRKHHADHQYIAAGYDDEVGTVHLIDPSPWQPSTQSIPLDLFLACWDTSAIPGEGQGPQNWTWLEVSARRPPLSPRQVSAVLQRNCKSMSVSSDREHLFVGLKGIEQLAEDTGVWAGYEKSLLKAHLRRCAEQFLEIALLREGHGHFLRHISPVCDRPGLATLGREFGSISQSWFVVKNLCFKGAVKETASVVPRIQARLREIAARERTALATLTEVMGL